MIWSSTRRNPARCDPSSRSVAQTQTCQRYPATYHSNRIDCYARRSLAIDGPRAEILGTETPGKQSGSFPDRTPSSMHMPHRHWVDESQTTPSRQAPGPDSTVLFPGLQQFHRPERNVVCDFLLMAFVMSHLRFHKIQACLGRGTSAKSCRCQTSFHCGQQSRYLRIPTFPYGGLLGASTAL